VTSDQRAGDAEIGAKVQRWTNDGERRRISGNWLTINGPAAAPSTPLRQPGRTRLDEPGLSGYWEAPYPPPRGHIMDKGGHKGGGSKTAGCGFDSSPTCHGFISGFPWPSSTCNLQEHRCSERAEPQVSGQPHTKNWTTKRPRPARGGLILSGLAWPKTCAAPAS